MCVPPRLLCCPLPTAAHWPPPLPAVFYQHSVGDSSFLTAAAAATQEGGRALRGIERPEMKYSETLQVGWKEQDNEQGTTWGMQAAARVEDRINMYTELPCSPHNFTWRWSDHLHGCTHAMWLATLPAAAHPRPPAGC